MTPSRTAADRIMWACWALIAVAVATLVAAYAYPRVLGVAAVTGPSLAATVFLEWRYYTVNVAAGAVLVLGLVVIPGSARRLSEFVFVRFPRVRASARLLDDDRAFTVLLIVVSASLNALAMLSTALIMTADTSGYIAVTDALLAGEGIKDLPGTRPPGMAFIYALAIALFGAGAGTAIQALNHAMVVASVYMAYAVAARLLPPPVAKVAGVMLALNLTYISTADYMLTEVYNGFFSIAALYGYFRFRATGRAAWLALGFFSAFLATLVRHECVVVGIFLALAVLAERIPRLRTGSGRPAPSWRVVVGTFLFFLAPWQGANLYNYLERGWWGLSSANGAFLYSGVIVYGHEYGRPVVDADSAAVREIMAATEWAARERRDVLPPEDLWKLEFGRHSPGNILAYSLMYPEKSRPEVEKVFLTASIDSILRHKIDFLKMTLFKVYVTIFNDVYVVSSTSPLPGDTYSMEHGIKNIVGALRLHDVNDRPPPDNLKTPNSEYHGLIRIMRGIYGFQQSLSGILGLTWNHLVLLGFVVWLAERATFEWFVFAGFAALKAIAPVVLAFGYQRYYYPGLPLLVMLGVLTTWRLVAFGDRLAAVSRED